MGKLKLNIQLFGGSLSITASETDVSVDNNTSYINLTIKATTNSTTYNDSAYLKSATITGQNNTYTLGRINFNIGKGQTVTVYSGKIGPFTHNADGSLNNVSISASAYIVSNTQPTASASVAMSTIPRASSVATLSGGTIGSTLSGTIERYSTSFTHTVYIKQGSRTQTILTKSSNTSFSTTIDMAFCNNITTGGSNGNATATAFVCVDTYNGDTKIGDTISSGFTMSVPSSVVPVINSVTKSDTANLLGTYGAYVQGKSNLRVQTNAGGSYSSWITNIAVYIKSGNTVLQTFNGSDITLGNINYTGTITVQVTVTDSRNRTTTNSSNISVAGYSNPYISYFTAERLNNDSTVTLKWSSGITNVNNANVNGKTFKLYKRQKGTSSWGSAILTYTSAYTYSRNDYTVTCSEDYGWEFKLDAIDSFATSSKTAEVGTAFELMNWKADGTALAVGKVSEESNTFEVGLSSKFLRGVSAHSGFELFHATPYIDFHFNNSTSDYTSRIIESSSGTLETSGNLNVGGRLTTSNWATENTTDTWVPVWRDGYLEHRVINANINNAMQGTARTPVPLTSTGASNTKWHVIGLIEYNSHYQGSFCYVKIMIGDGNNGNDYQQAWIDLYLQLGWTGSNNGRFGGYAIMNTNRTTFNWSNTQLKVFSNGSDSRVNYCIALQTNKGYVVPNIYAHVPSFATFKTHDTYYDNTWGNECILGYGYEGEVVLYNDSTGTNGNVTLNDNAGNYTYIEIFFRDNNSQEYHSEKIYSPNGKSTTIGFIRNYADSSALYSYLYSKNITINGTTITSNRNDYTQFRAKVVNDHNSNNNVYIFRVVGYKV